MVLADKYNVEGLIQICRDIILESLDNDRAHQTNITDSSNVVGAIILGYQLNDDTLKHGAMEKLVRHGKMYLKEFAKWDELKKYPDLMMEIMENYGTYCLDARIARTFK